MLTARSATELQHTSQLRQKAIQGGCPMAVKLPGQKSPVGQPVSRVRPL